MTVNDLIDILTACPSGSALHSLAQRCANMLAEHPDAQIVVGPRAIPATELIDIYSRRLALVSPAILGTSLLGLEETVEILRATSGNGMTMASVDIQERSLLFFLTGNEELAGCIVSIKN